MQQVLCFAAFRPHLEHHRCEQVTARLLNINLDATDDTDFDVWDGLDNALNILVSDLVHGVSELGHGLLGHLNLFEVRL